MMSGIDRNYCHATELRRHQSLADAKAWRLISSSASPTGPARARWSLRRRAWPAALRPALLRPVRITDLLSLPSRSVEPALPPAAVFGTTPPSSTSSAR